MNSKKAVRFRNKLQALMEETQAIRNHLDKMHRKKDAVSAAPDRRLVNAEVLFEPALDGNDSFAEVFTSYLDTAR